MTTNVVTLENPRPTSAPLTSLIPSNLSQAMQLADMMSQASLVPQHLQKKPADCLLVIEQASRWQMSPFAVAQATSCIKGKLMFEGKLVTAAINASGALSGRLDFTFKGEGSKRIVTVTGTLKGEKQPRTVDVSFAEAKTENNMWSKQPDQQLCYHGARVWARRHVPEIMLGVYAPEEFDETQTRQADVVTIDEIPSAPKDNKPEASPDTGNLEKIKADFEKCSTIEALKASGKEWEKVIHRMSGDNQARARKLFEEHYYRIQPKQEDLIDPEKVLKDLEDELAVCAFPQGLEETWESYQPTIFKLTPPDQKAAHSIYECALENMNKAG